DDDDPNWLASQYESARAIVFNRCRYRTRASHNLCEDAIDLAFLKVWEDNPYFPNSLALVGWLTTAAVNHIYDQRRKVQTHRRLVEFLRRGGHGADWNQAGEMDRFEEVGRLETAFQRLSSDDRAVLTLYYHEHLKDREVAKRIGLNRVGAHHRRRHALQ